MRTTDPQISFADLEFIKQGVGLEPTLKAIADFLDQHAAIVRRVRHDLVRGMKKPATGRTGLTAQQVLRSMILMRVKNWEYRELRERIADGYTLRHFTAFNGQRVPKHDAFNGAVNRLTPVTLQAVNDAVIRAAVNLGLEEGTKLRVDTMVVETDIHHPTRRHRALFDPERRAASKQREAEGHETCGRAAYAVPCRPRTTYARLKLDG